MEYAKSAGVFEDHSTIAMLNRNTPVPAFTTSTTGGVLTITTSAVKLTYKVGSGNFTADSLSVADVTGTSAFTTWSYGQVSGPPLGRHWQHPAPRLR